MANFHVIAGADARPAFPIVRKIGIGDLSAALTAGIFVFATTTSARFAMWALQGQWTWLAVMGLFILTGVISQRLAQSETSRGVQYLGLSIAVIAEAVILQPMLWLVYARFGRDSDVSPVTIISQAGIITMAIFIGLSLTVFISKKDFSFMRGMLSIATMAFIGLMIASLIFGFHMGSLFAGFGVMLMGGYILYQTSAVMKSFPPTHHVAAALMLFSTIATLFWYVLQLLMNSRRN